MMTVADLIKKLDGLPPSTPVVIWGDDSTYREARAASQTVSFVHSGLWEDYFRGDPTAKPVDVLVIRASR